MKTKDRTMDNDSAAVPRNVRVDDLAESPRNLRRTYDKEALDDLARSVKEKGVLVPLIVRRWTQKNPAHYEIVAGHRRLRAAKLAGLVQVPCTVMDLTDEEALEVGAIENLQRADVHPMEESDAYAAMVAGGKYGKEGAVGEIAKRLGKTPEYVGRRLLYQALGAKARAAFLEGRLLIGHADLLCRLTVKDQDDALRSWGDEGMTISELRRDIEEVYRCSLKTAAFDIADAGLVKRAGPCTTCPKRTGATASLFGEDAKDDRCSDMKCFGAKSEAHFDAVAKRLEASGDKVVFLSFSWRQDGSSFVGRPVLRESLFTVKPGTTGTKGIVVVTGHGSTAKVGDVLNVEVASAAKRPTRDTGGSDKERAAYEKKRSEVKVAIGKGYRDALRRAIEAKLPKKFDTKALRAFVLAETVKGHRCGDALKVLGVKRKGDETQARKELARRMPKLDEPAVIKVAMMSACARDLDPSGWELEHCKVPTAVALAGSFGIDCEAILKEVKKANPYPEKPGKKHAIIDKGSKKPLKGSPEAKELERKAARGKTAKK